MPSNLIIRCVSRLSDLAALAVRSDGVIGRLGRKATAFVALAGKPDLAMLAQLVPQSYCLRSRLLPEAQPPPHR